MRARVSKATMKRLARLEQTRNVLRCVGGWGPILDHDEWETLAVATQEKLIADTRDYLGERYPDDADSQKAQARAQRAYEQAEEARAANKAAGDHYRAAASEHLRAQAESVRRATVR
jgi:hypothetical protein